MSETPTAPESGAALLARIRPRLREEKTQICLRPDLLEAWEDAQEELQQNAATGGVNRRLADGTSGSEELADRVQKLEAEIEAHSMTFLFRAMSKDAWSALTADHPPRPGDKLDLYIGYDRDAVLDAAVRASMVSPVFEDCIDPECDHIDCGTWQQFLPVVNPSEWTELRDTVNSVNRSVTDPPKSLLASRILSRRASDSGQLVLGE